MYRGLRPAGAYPHAERPRATICTSQGRQTMSERITSFIGFDMHIDSIAVGVATRGRAEPHFVGSVAPQ